MESHTEVVNLEVWESRIKQGIWGGTKDPFKESYGICIYNNDIYKLQYIIIYVYIL